MEDQYRHRILATLKKETNLGLASEAELMDLARSARLLSFDKDSCIFTPGDDSDHVFLVESGRVILSKPAPSGKIFTSLIAVQGTTLNAITCFGGRPKFLTARVAEETSIIAIPCPVFKTWVLGHPNVVAGILSTMGDLLDGAYTRIMDLIDESAENRVLNALHMLCSKIGPDLPLTNSDVADMTGVSRETAARVISRLHRLGLVAKSRGCIKILDRTQLEGMTTSPFFIL